MLKNTPNLFIIGAPKSGTTTLHSLLEQHPQVFMSEPKEPRFFSRDSEYQKGFDWYLDTYFHDSSNHKILGEATPTYLYLNQKTIPRIKQHLQDSPIKFIAILRNPVDRAYSHYWFNRNTKLKLTESLSFEDALATENERLANSPEFYAEGRVSYAYFQIGLYASQAQAFINAFGEQNCLWLLFEDIFTENFQRTINNIEKFLEIDTLSLKYAKKKESIQYRSKTLAFLIRQSRELRKVASLFIPEKLRSNLKSSLISYNAKAFQYPSMQPQTRQMLVEKYKPSINDLEKIIGRDLSHWK